MSLDPVALQTPGTPEHWMQYMASLLTDRYRTVQFARLDAYRRGCPPICYLAASDRKAFYQVQEMARVNLARKVVRAKSDRMRVRAIRTAAATDDRGDTVAWRYWTRSGLFATADDVHTDQLTFNEGYVRVSIAEDGVTPIALRRDPKFCIAIPDPLDPLRTLAGFELLWDDTTGTSYAYLWIRGRNAAGESVGQQWVATSQQAQSPRLLSLPGLTYTQGRPFDWWWPRLTFTPGSFTMRPRLEDVAPEDRDGGPYCQDLGGDVVPLFRFTNRNGVGEFAENIGTLDRINRTILQRVVTQAVQAYRQRALKQQGASGQMPGTDQLSKVNPETNEAIDWDSVFEPGPDALWKLPPGVDIWESQPMSSADMLSAEDKDIRKLSVATDTPLPLLSDDVNQSAEGAQFRKEDTQYAVENCRALAGGTWAQVIACMFLFAPDSERYATAGRGRAKVDRADPGQIVVDWAPVERYSLSERADADSKNKTLSLDEAASRIWGLSPDEVARNREQRKSDMIEIPMQFRPSQLPAGLAANEVDAPASPTSPVGATQAQAAPATP